MAKVLVTGHKAIDKKLKTIEAKLGRKVLRKAMRESLKPTLKTAQDLAPIGETGALKDSVKIKPGKRKRGVISLLVALGAGWFKGSTFYAAFVELGTSRIKARRFMTQAYEREKEAALADAERRIREGLDKIIQGK